MNAKKRPSLTLLCLALFAGGGALAAWFLARKDVS